MLRYGLIPIAVELRDSNGLWLAYPPLETAYVTDGRVVEVRYRRVSRLSRIRVGAGAGASDGDEGE